MRYLNVEIDWPLDRNVIRRGLVNHTFGMVRTNPNGTPRAHQGWDFHALVNTPVYAVADGQIMYVSNTGDYGLTVVQRIGDTEHFAVYAHLNDTKLRQGDSVKRGGPIGLSGDSGNARGMLPDDQHLHFELRTSSFPGRGLANRLSPIQLFGVCPMTKPEYRQAEK